MSMILKKVVIAGAGASGAVLAKILKQRHRGLVLNLVDRDSKTLRQLWPRRSANVRFHRLDLRQGKTLLPLLKGGGLLINAASIHLNLSLMKTALRAGAAYQDLSSALEDDTTLEQLSLKKEFKAAGLPALICAGVAPGISSLMAAQLASEFDKVENISIRFLEDQQASGLFFPWAPDIALEDCFCKSLTWYKHRFVRRPPLSAPEMVRFPGTLGSHESVRIFGEEAATLPRYIDCVSVDVKSGGSDIEAARQLWASLPNQKKWQHWIRSQNFKVTGPRDLVAAARKGEITNAWFAIAVVVSGRTGKQKQTRRMDAVFPDFKTILKRMPGASYIGWPTGLSAALFAERVFECPAGVYAPEALTGEKRRQILRELKAYGVRLRRRVL